MEQRNLGAIMILPLQELDAIILDQIDATVFLCEATRPDAGARIFQGFGFADAGEG
jgi:hypothetical protein